MQSPPRARRIWLVLLTTLIIIVFWRVPVLAQDPPTEQLELGAQLYAENCAVCHGPNGEGRVGAELSKDWPSIRPDLRVKMVIEQGVWNMIAITEGLEQDGAAINNDVIGGKAGQLQVIRMRLRPPKGLANEYEPSGTNHPDERLQCSLVPLVDPRGADARG